MLSGDCNIVPEGHRRGDLRTDLGSLLDAVFWDLRIALRSLRRTPVFAIVVVFTLALGIGANSAVFSLIDQLLLRRLPFPQSERLFTIHYKAPERVNRWSNLAYPEYLWFQTNAADVLNLAAYLGTEVQLGGMEPTVSVQAELVSWNYFEVLRVSPILGRSFVPEEDEVPGRDRVAVLGYELWQQYFGGDPAIIGRVVTVNAASFIVIGVAPRGFAGLRIDRRGRPELWVPFMAYTRVHPTLVSASHHGDLRNYWASQILSATGRLNRDISLEQAQVRFDSLVTRLFHEHWQLDLGDSSRAKWSVQLVAANEARFPVDSRQNIRRFLSMLLVVVAIILLLCCSNISSLMVARATRNRREIAVRLAIGAGRTQLLRQLLTEGGVLAITGAFLGLLFSWGALQVLAHIPRPFGLQLLLDATLNLRVLLFSIVLSLTVTVVLGLVPMREFWRLDLTAAMRGGDLAPCRSFRARQLLVIVQVASSLVLTFGAGLFVQTLRNARASDPTVEADKVLLVRLARPKQEGLFYAEVLERVHGLPGVRAAAFVAVVPFGGRRGGTNISVPESDSATQVDWNVVTEQYFETVGLPLTLGRSFNTSDRAGGQPVAIVNEEMAKRLWPGKNPIGRHVKFTNPARIAEVVGVVRDGRFRGYREEVQPCIYAPLPQERPFLAMNLEVRADRDPLSLARAVVHEIQSVDGAAAISEITTLSEFRDYGLGQERVAAALLSGLGVVGLAMSTMGIYGLLAFAVSQRKREIGVRMALGATALDVFSSIGKEVLVMVGLGTSLGCTAGLFLAKSVSSLLYGVTAGDLPTLMATISILAITVAAAALVPVGRAIRIDPADTLRCN